MRIFRRTFPFLAESLFLGCLIFLSEAPAQNATNQDPDRSVKAGDDFYHYANGNWLRNVTIPVGQSSYDNRAMMAERTSQRVREIVQDAATSHGAKGSIAQKVGDYYASFLDTDRIEAQGLRPVLPELAEIKAIADTISLSAYLGATVNSEVDGLTANGDHIVGIWINQGFEHSEHNLPHIWQWRL